MIFWKASSCMHSVIIPFVSSETIDTAMGWIEIYKCDVIKSATIENIVIESPIYIPTDNRYNLLRWRIVPWHDFKQLS